MMLPLACLAGVTFAGWLYFRRCQTGLPDGTVLYSDAGRRHAVRPLLSQRYGLAGRPDYLVNTSHGVVPIELKSAPYPRSGPRDGDIAQVLAYCVLVEDVLKVRVPYGIIQYADAQHTVPYARSERESLIALVAEIRRSHHHTTLHRSHSHSARCRSCGYNPVCGEDL